MHTILVLFVEYESSFFSVKQRESVEVNCSPLNFLAACSISLQESTCIFIVACVGTKYPTSSVQKGKHTDTDPRHLFSINPSIVSSVVQKPSRLPRMEHKSMAPNYCVRASDNAFRRANKGAYRTN
jgi:hypothetical protein